MASNRKDTSNTGNNKARSSSERGRNEQATRVRDDGRRDTDLDDDRTDQRMTAQNEANRRAHEAMPQGGGDIQGTWSGDRFFMAGSRQKRLSTISFLISAMAFPGLRPLGQTWVQLRMVWQR